MRRTARLFVMSLAGSASLSLLSTAALASEPFPDTIRTRWSVPNRKLPVEGPGCRLCHSRDSGGANTVVTAWGVRIKTTYRVGSARQGGTNALERALDTMKANGDDTDRDRVSDYEELAKDITNPSDPQSRRPPDVVPSEGGAGGEDGAGGGQNEGGAPSEPPLQPLPPLPPLPPPLGHGCSVPARPSGDGWLALAALALFGSAARRRTIRNAG
jgi:MYXO-CTERM domain-containing protein